MFNLMESTDTLPQSLKIITGFAKFLNFSWSFILSNRESTMQANDYNFLLALAADGKNFL